MASDSRPRRELNATRSAVEFKVESVTKSILVKASTEKDAGWAHGHSPEDLCLCPPCPITKEQARFVAIRTGDTIRQLDRAGTKDIDKHFEEGPFESRGTYRGSIIMAKGLSQRSGLSWITEVRLSSLDDRNHRAFPILSAGKGQNDGRERRSRSSSEEELDHEIPNQHLKVLRFFPMCPLASTFSMYSVARGTLQAVSPTSTDTFPIFFAAAFACFNRGLT